MLEILETFCLLFLFISLGFKIKYVFEDIRCPWTGNQLFWVQKVFFRSLEDFAKFWHKYEIHDLEYLNYNANESYLLVGYHSRTVLDLIYTICTLKPRALISHLVFEIPVIKHFLEPLGFIPSKLEDGKPADEKFVQALLTSPVPLLLLPGGVWECLKPYDQQNKIQWKSVPGYVRVLFENKAKFVNRKVKVVPFYTRNCELCYSNYETLHDIAGNIGMKLYNQYKSGNVLVLPIMLTIILLSFGNIFLPRPVKLDTFIGQPLVMEEKETAEAFALRVNQSMQVLIDSSIATQQKKVREIPSAEKERLCIAVYTVVQNIVLLGLLLTCIWLTYPFLLAYTLYTWISSQNNNSMQKRSLKRD